MSISRIVRGEILSLREQDFVVAARGFGGGPFYILRRHLLPNIFGPVLVLIPYDDEDEAIDIANDTPYGLAGYVQAGDLERAVRVASRIRAGSIHINGQGPSLMAPFGGYKQSGNGREWGVLGFEEFLETKSVFVPRSA